MSGSTDMARVLRSLSARPCSRAAVSTAWVGSDNCASASPGDWALMSKATVSVAVSPVTFAEPCPTTTMVLGGMLGSLTSGDATSGWRTTRRITENDPIATRTNGDVVEAPLAGDRPLASTRVPQRRP